MDIVRAVADIDQSNDLHEARLLVLLNAFSGDAGDETIDGLTKLAKLDFLLRYPVMLERALKARGRSVRGVKLLDHERMSVESEMVRYRFGPWDHRYRSFLNILVAKGLASISIKGRKITIAITGVGRELAKKLTANELFEQYTARSEILKRHFDLTATALMRFIYKTFPEILSLRSNAPIPT
ncbi:hypothetical protein ES708_06430 [subsurface metagenome]